MVAVRPEERAAARICTLPNMISIFRLLLVPFMLWFAFSDRAGLFLTAFGVSLLSDVLDGLLARLTDQQSLLGARLDSCGDYAMYLAAVASAWILWPALIMREAFYFSFILISTAVSTLTGLLRYAHLPCYHTWGVKASAVLLGGSGFLLFAGASAIPFRIFSFLFVIAQIEVVAIILVLPEWRPNVHTLWHALHKRP